MPRRCDIAVDLGRSNTLVYVVNRGIIIEEPSVVAVSVRRAPEICGRAPRSARPVAAAHLRTKGEGATHIA